MEYFNNLASKLKEAGLDESKVNEVVEFSKKKVPLEFRKKSDYKQLQREFETFKENAKEKDELINSLKDKAESVEEYEQNIQNLTQKLEEKDQQHQQVVSQIKFDNEIKRKVNADNDINPKAKDVFYNMLNKEEIKLDQHTMF